MKSLASDLLTYVNDGYISLSVYDELILKHACSFRDVEQAVFDNGWMPLRYHRNQNSLSQKEQAKLFHAHVLIIGCGGLGGHVAELLARVGVGNITLFDGDVYEEHNLNRQNFSTPAMIGLAKATVVSKGLQAINPALNVYPHHLYFDETNVNSFLEGIDVVVDALDAPEMKLFVATTCKERNLPFIHGAIAGWFSQVSTSKELSKLYHEEGKGAEAKTGNLPFTASLCASMQSALVLKALLNKESLDETLWMIDLLDNESVQLPL